MVCIAAFIILCLVGVFVAFLSIFDETSVKILDRFFKKHGVALEKGSSPKMRN